jgi:hypothetical protein
MADHILPEGSLLARLTDRDGLRPENLKPREGIAVLTRLYRALLYAYWVKDANDFVARLDAERDVLRLRKELYKETFGLEA